MPADALHYKFIAVELNDALKNGRIDKITASAQDTVRLHVYAGGKNRILVLSMSAAAARCHLTISTTESLPTLPPFATHLKKHLTCGRIQSVTAKHNERILKFHIETKDELGFGRDYTLVAEIMGKHSNLILLNAENKITDCMKHISLDLSSKRQVFPGLSYESAPSQGKTAPDDLDAVTAVMEAYNGGDLEEYLLRNISGLSPASIKEAVNLATHAGQKTNPGGATPDSFLPASVLRLFDEKNLAPCVRLDGNGNVADFYLMPYLSVPGEYERTVSLNEAADRYYTFRECNAAFEGKKNKLTGAVKSSITRSEKRLATLLDQKLTAEDYEDERIHGEILTANLYRIKPGDKVLICENYYTDPSSPIEIRLDDALSPAKLAQRHYKKYQKKKKTLEAVTPQISAVQDNLEYLESVSIALKNAELPQDLDEIAEELRESGVIKSEERKTKHEKRRTGNSAKNDRNPLAGVKRTEFEGFIILTGKNNTQNDALVKQSAPNDIWLHPKDIHGAHTVINNPAKKMPPDSVLKKAAALTALYSKAGASENVPVDYTFIKFVSKPKSAAPGKVVYTNQRTVYITPGK